MAECRWEWTKPDKPGRYWWGRDDRDSPNIELRQTLEVRDSSSKMRGWWAYIGPLTPEPLPPKKKVTQTLWMVPTGQNIELFYKRWLSTDDTIPPGAIETVQKREIEL